jgi:sugar phosphate isomerase/epimerase
MRVGTMALAETAQLDWLQRLGFRSFEWVRFDTSPAGPRQEIWQPFVDELAAAIQERGLRISAIAAFYRNPLDPRQTEYGRAAIQRAIAVAARLSVKTVTAFAGGVIETDFNERGGNPVYRPLENSLPQLLAFWEPLAQLAADHGVRIGFENCPQSPSRLPIMGYNFMGQPAHWERLFDATRCGNLGLEWDPSHLICQFIDPVFNIQKFGSRIFHVHAKDAYINRRLMDVYGVCHPGVLEHRFPGLGQANWPEIIHALLRIGYDSDLTIEGRHDPVYRDHVDAPEATKAPGKPDPLAGAKLEDTGILIAKRLLEQYIPDESERRN